MGNPTADIRVGVGRDNKDSLYAHVPNLKDAWVIPNGGAAEYLEETGDIQGAKYLTVMNLQKKNKYKNGRLPGFDGGKWGVPEWTNLGTNAIGMIGSLVDAHNIENEPLSNPNTRKTNPYANVALKTMADIRYNNYQAYNDLWDTVYKHTHAVNNNGNLSAAQRAVMNYAGYKDAMDSMAKINQYG